MKGEAECRVIPVCVCARARVCVWVGKCDMRAITFDGLILTEFILVKYNILKKVS